MSAPGVDISVVIPSFSREDSLRRLLESIANARKETRFPIEVVVVCAGYPAGVVASLPVDKAVQFDTMPRVSAARNAGATVAQGRYLLFVDDDNIVAPDMFVKLHDAMEAKPACVVAPVMYYAKERERPWCITVHRTSILARTIFERNSNLISGDLRESEDFPNCFMVRTDEFRAVGGFDEQRFPQHFEESDLCRRLVSHTGKGVFCVTSASDWHDIDPEPMRQLHLKSEYMAYQCARARAVFLALYGTRVQWYAYLLVGQWLFASFYISVVIRDRGWMGARSLALHYLRGLADGLKQGTVARSAR